jgi:hypothetical protein
MFDTTLDLFCYNEELNDRQHMVDTMAETLFDAMTTNANKGENFDAIACYEEWVVDGKDPQDGDVEIIFVPDLTGEREEN